MEIDVLITKLDDLAKRFEDFKIDNKENLLTFKRDIEKRFDDSDRKFDKIIANINQQEKINLKHEILIDSLDEKVCKIDGKIDSHIGEHSKKDLLDIEDKTETKGKVKILWGIAVFIAMQIGIIIFLIIKGIIKIG